MYFHCSMNTVIISTSIHTSAQMPTQKNIIAWNPYIYYEAICFFANISAHTASVLFMLYIKLTYHMIALIPDFIQDFACHNEAWLMRLHSNIYIIHNTFCVCVCVCLRVFVSGYQNGETKFCTANNWNYIHGFNANSIHNPHGFMWRKSSRITKFISNILQFLLKFPLFFWFCLLFLHAPSRSFHFDQNRVCIENKATFRLII